MDQIFPELSVGHVVQLSVLNSPHWMLCDGRELSSSEFPVLFEVIKGYSVPKSESATFKLPDAPGYSIKVCRGYR